MVSGSFCKSVLDIDLLVGEYQPDVVYIDGTHLLWPEKQDGRQARWERMAEVGEGIQELALKWNRPIIQTVQFNREGTDIVDQVSSVVLGLFPGDSPDETTRRKIMIMKNRDRALGEFETNFLFNPPNFDWIMGNGPASPLEWAV
jgi:hypothetical protein